MFAAAFSSAFAGVRPAYVGPVMAQAALVAGAGADLTGVGLKIGGKILIGPAGKVYQFASPESAARWVNNTMSAGVREVEILAGVAPDVRQRWVSRKREKLAVIADRVVAAAARMADDGRRAALLAEADFCLTKWG